jgi:hypothetical protein
LLFLIVTAVGGFWFAVLLVNGDAHIIKEFIEYQIRLFRTEDADHGGSFFYHFIILFIGCFPAAALSLLSMRKTDNESGYARFFHLRMQILFWVTLILFSIVKTKIIHYSSLCYFPLTYMGALSFYHIALDKKANPLWNKIIQVVTGLLFVIALIAVTKIDLVKEWLLKPGRIHDEFARGNLHATVIWSGWEIFPGLVLLSGIILFIVFHKKNYLSLLFLFLASLISVNMATVMIAPKVEGYSQRAAIEFYISKQNEKCIVEPLGFKSYAHLFYAQRLQQFSGIEENMIFTVPLPKDVNVYAVIKTQDADAYEKKYSQLKRLYDKNGFVFYKLQR